LMDGINIRHQRKKLCGTQHTDEHSPAPTAFVMARDCCIRSTDCSTRQQRLFRRGRRHKTFLSLTDLGGAVLQKNARTLSKLVCS
jgi:hypothetical protein